MTDKQIIIDYKNLCENYSKEVGCFGTFDGSCIKEQCFTYKLLQQLKRKEQECETLASQLDFEVQKKECLEQECEELKNEYWKLEQGNDFLAEKNSRLRGCLTEIKEIASREAETSRYNGSYTWKQILQKISEVEDEHNG